MPFFIIREVYGDGDKYDGLTWLNAISGGKMAYDTFSIWLYFDKIDQINEGSAIKPSVCYFSFPYSSLGSNTTDHYDGKITLKEKGDDYAVIHFEKVLFSVAYGDYVFNSDLKCPILNKYPWDKE